VVSSSKYTGAAAVAEGWCRALREAGADARLIYVSGANLERRLRDAGWSHAVLVKERCVADVRHNLRALRKLADHADVVICHLPHDHAEAVAAAVHRHSVLVRAFRRPRHLRRDPFHRALARRVAGALAPFDGARRRTETLTGRPTLVVPAVVEDRFTVADDDVPEVRGHAARRQTAAWVLGMVGKLARGRGFELLLDAAALTDCRCEVVVVGHGELRPDLEERAAARGLSRRVVWAGKRETDLPDLYRTMDTVLFAAPGSDWGHRAITEAQACGRPVVAVDRPGVADLIDDRRTGLVVDDDSRSVAAAVDALAADEARARQIGSAAAAAVAPRRMRPVGERLLAFLDGLL
jgi:glycosyltransferase involved in cell wall biosynthesis